MVLNWRLKDISMDPALKDRCCRLNGGTWEESLGICSGQEEDPERKGTGTLREPRESLENASVSALEQETLSSRNDWSE